MTAVIWGVLGVLVIAFLAAAQRWSEPPEYRRRRHRHRRVQARGSSTATRDRWTALAAGHTPHGWTAAQAADPAHWAPGVDGLPRLTDATATDLPGPAAEQLAVSDPEGATGVNAPHRAGESPPRTHPRHGWLRLTVASAVWRDLARELEAQATRPWGDTTGTFTAITEGGGA